MRSLQLWSKVALIVALTVIWQWAASTNVSAQEVEFNFDTSNGIPLTRGQVITSITVDGLTMGIEVDSNGANDAAMIFDTSNPGTADPDLGAPNETCPNPPVGGWPGVGAGGVISTTTAPNRFENCEPRGNVLIIPELVPFDPAAGPDDDAAGGIITLTFNVPVQVLQIDILDIDEPDSEDRIPKISFLNSSGTPITFTVGGIVVNELEPEVAGDNGYEEFFIADVITSTFKSDVSTIIGTFIGSGSLATIVVIPNPTELYEFRKYVNGFDANFPDGADTPHLLAGTQVTWTYHVTNTGKAAVPFASVVVTDSDLDVDPVFNQILLGNDDQNLDPGEVWEYIATGVVPDPLTSESISISQNLCGPDSGTEWGYKNIATLTVNNTIRLTDPAHICILESEYEFRKYVNGFDANFPDGTDTPHLQAGTPVTWTYHVTNTGSVPVPFASLTITDSDPLVTPAFGQELLGNADQILDPDEVWEYIATGIVPDPLTSESISISRNLCGPDSGTEWGYKNISTLTVDNIIRLTDPAHICIEVLEPAIKVIRIETYELSYTVTNPPIENEGVPLENIVVRAASPEVTIACPKTTLNPNESMVCAATATNIAFRNSLGWVTADPVSGGKQIIRVVLPNRAADSQ